MAPVVVLDVPLVHYFSTGGVAAVAHYFSTGGVVAVVHYISTAVHTDQKVTTPQRHCELLAQKVTVAPLAQKVTTPQRRYELLAQKVTVAPLAQKVTTPQRHCELLAQKVTVASLAEKVTVASLTQQVLLGKMCKRERPSPYRARARTLASRCNPPYMYYHPDDTNTVYYNAHAVYYPGFA